MSVSVLLTVVCFGQDTGMPYMGLDGAGNLAVDAGERDVVVTAAKWVAPPASQPFHIHNSPITNKGHHIESSSRRQVVVRERWYSNSITHTCCTPTPAPNAPPPRTCTNNQIAHKNNKLADACTKKTILPCPHTYLIL